jgi:hypothetical protein
MEQELEAAIDRAGRDKVFARAQSYGWPPGSSPPPWVWWQIAQELIREAGELARQPVAIPGQAAAPLEQAPSALRQQLAETGPRLAVDNTKPTSS